MNLTGWAVVRPLLVEPAMEEAHPLEEAAQALRQNSDPELELVHQQP
jgi:hypothetical protein